MIRSEQRTRRLVGARLDGVDVVAPGVEPVTGSPSAYLSLSQLPRLSRVLWELRWRSPPDTCRAVGVRDIAQRETNAVAVVLIDSSQLSDDAFARSAAAADRDHERGSPVPVLDDRAQWRRNLEPARLIHAADGRALCGQRTLCLQAQTDGNRVDLASQAGQRQSDQQYDASGRVAAEAASTGVRSDIASRTGRPNPS